jgi:8-oxo-dGTP diphosphatase
VAEADPRPPIIVAAAILRRDGDVLLTRRMEGAHLAGYWEFPGGKVEPGEDPEEALVRECREECGIEVRVEDVVDVTFHRYDQKDVLLLFYDCKLLSGEVRHLGVADHVWCPPGRLSEYRLPPPDERVVRKLAAGGESLDSPGGGS